MICAATGNAIINKKMLPEQRGSHVDVILGRGQQQHISDNMVSEQHQSWVK